MGILTCPRCKAKTQADSIDEGRCRLDHAIGLYVRKPCYDGLVELQFTGTEKKTVTGAAQTEKPSKNTLTNLKDKLIPNSTKKSNSKKE